MLLLVPTVNKNANPDPLPKKEDEKKEEEEGVFLCSQAPCLITITFPPRPNPIDEILAVFHLTPRNSMFTFVALFCIINLLSVFVLVGQKGTGSKDCQVKM